MSCCPLPPLAAAMRVLWTDGATYVLHKPAGVATQDLPMLLNRRLRRSTAAQVWLPHRIDKYTEGLQVVTLSKEACSALSRSGEQRRWHKRYRALACVPAHLQGFGAEPTTAAAAQVPAELRGSPLLCAAGTELAPAGAIESRIARRPLRPRRSQPLHPFVPNCMLFEALRLERGDVGGSPECAQVGKRAPTAPGEGRKQSEGAWSRTHFELVERSRCGVSASTFPFTRRC
jgi:hypothetical protein|eukprot:COSAG01_NODE_1213_length_11210_cov_9.262353_2_plen_231_part_00